MATIHKKVSPRKYYKVSIAQLICEVEGIYNFLSAFSGNIVMYLRYRISIFQPHLKEMQKQVIF